MANPTTNYGFVLPTSTDLVTDLPADFDVALQGVDTRLKALNPSTTLGDTNYASATANTNTRLAIGSTGQVLTVAGGVPTWATPASSGGMTLISTTTLSGASTTINSFGGYTNLMVRIFGATNATANGYARIEPNASASITNMNVAGGTSGGGKSIITGIDTFLYMNYVNDSLRTNANNTYSLQILDYASTSGFKPFFFTADFVTGAGSESSEFQIGTFTTTSAITSLVISNPGGNWSTGTVLVYGVK